MEENLRRSVLGFFSHFSGEGRGSGKVIPCTESPGWEMAEESLEARIPGLVGVSFQNGYPCMHFMCIFILNVTSLIPRS